jgi:hypothetical protein
VQYQSHELACYICNTSKCLWWHCMSLCIPLYAVLDTSCVRVLYRNIRSSSVLSCSSILQSSAVFAGNATCKWIVVFRFLCLNLSNISWFKTNKTKLHGLNPRTNYTDRATAACRRSDCQLLWIKGATWSAWRIPSAVFSVFYTGAATFI